MATMKELLARQEELTAGLVQATAKVDELAAKYQEARSHGYAMQLSYNELLKHCRETHSGFVLEDWNEHITGLLTAIGARNRFTPQQRLAYFAVEREVRAIARASDRPLKLEELREKFLAQPELVPVEKPPRELAEGTADKVLANGACQGCGHGAGYHGNADGSQNVSLQGNRCWLKAPTLDGVEQQCNCSNFS